MLDQISCFLGEVISLGTRVDLFLNDSYTGKDMGDGWETKRSRTKGHKDWAIIKLYVRVRKHTKLHNISTEAQLSCSPKLIGLETVGTLDFSLLSK